MVVVAAEPLFPPQRFLYSTILSCTVLSCTNLTYTNLTYTILCRNFAGVFLLVRIRFYIALDTLCSYIMSYSSSLSP